MTVRRTVSIRRPPFCCCAARWLRTRSLRGRLVLLAPYYSTSVWEGVRPIGQLPVVSDLQLVLDLWHYPVRGREQAEHLIEMRFPAE